MVARASLSLTKWSVASVAICDQLMAFWMPALATQSVVRDRQTTGQPDRRQIHKQHPQTHWTRISVVGPETSPPGDFDTAILLEALVF